MSGPCILIVEQDLLVRTPLAEYLRECGYLGQSGLAAVLAHTRRAGRTTNRNITGRPMLSHAARSPALSERVAAPASCPLGAGFFF
jgi:hypothetical protein